MMIRWGFRVQPTMWRSFAAAAVKSSSALALTGNSAGTSSMAYMYYVSSRRAFATVEHTQSALNEAEHRGSGSDAAPVGSGSSSIGSSSANRHLLRPIIAWHGEAGYDIPAVCAFAEDNKLVLTSQHQQQSQGQQESKFLRRRTPKKRFEDSNIGKEDRCEEGVACGSCGFEVALRYPAQRSTHSTIHQQKKAEKRKTPQVALLRATTSRNSSSDSTHADDDTYVAVFNNGALVGFGVSEVALKQLRAALRACEAPKDGMLQCVSDVLVKEQYTTFDALPHLGYESPEDISSSYVDEGSLGAVVLHGKGGPDQLLPFALCFQQLVELKALDTLLKPLAGRVSEWQRHVQQHGKLPMQVSEARVTKAVVLRIRSQQSKMGTDRHKMLWDETTGTARRTFLSACAHYEVNSLDEELRSRLSVVAESATYLCEECHKDTDLRLEWAIIILIAAEIVIHFLPHH